MNALLKYALVLAMPCYLLSTVAPALAQSVPAAADTAAVCMAYTPPSDPNAAVFEIILPADQESVMASRGYVDQACPNNPGALTQYRDGICTLADKGDAGVQRQFAQIWLATPRELCDYANAVAGPSSTL